MEHTRAQTPHRPLGGAPDRLLPLLVAVLAFSAFIPALRGEFLLLDDVDNFTDNPNYRSLGWSSLKWMFFSTQIGGVYMPLTWLSHGVDHLLWGMDPMGYHLGSMLIHCLSGVLFYFLARRLFSMFRPGDRPPGGEDADARWSAAFAAAFFAVHPLRVEAVAWISNRSYVLPGLFYIAALYSYLEAHAARVAGKDPGRWMSACTAAFVLSLFSKAVGATLPVVLLIADWYPLRRVGREGVWRWADLRPLLAEKAALFGWSAVSVAIAFAGRASHAQVAGVDAIGVAMRLAHAAYGSMYYLEKTLFPGGLAPWHLIPRGASPLDPAFFFRAAAFVILTAWVVRRARRSPGLLASWAAYLAALLPFLGLLAYGVPDQAVAEKWCYLASTHLSLAAGAGVLSVSRAWGLGRGPALRRSLLAGIACALVAAWAAASWRQSGRWRDTETLFTHNIAVEPGCYVCHDALAFRLSEQGRYDEALAHAKEGVRIAPGSASLRFNLSALLSVKGRADEAVEQARAAAAVAPENPHICRNLTALLRRRADALAAGGRPAEAASLRDEAARLESGPPCRRSP